MSLKVFAAIILSISAKITAESPRGVYFEIKENSFLSADTLWDRKADSLLSCTLLCAREAACESVNQRSCSLLGNGQTHLAEKLLKRLEGSFYAKKVFYLENRFRNHSNDKHVALI